MIIRNLTRDTILALKPKLAKGLYWRGRGMVGRKFEEFDALVFERCNAIHTFLMGMPIDVIFVDRDNKVCGLRKVLPAWRMAMERGAAMTIELPSEALTPRNCEIGDQLWLEL
jgi:uncharacterized membrane protein (UPF0127 family)